MAQAASHSFVQCLTAIAQHHGLQINPERLIHEYALTGEEPRPTLVVRMAQGIGLKARIAKLSWYGLFQQEGVFPFIGHLRNGKSIIIVGVRAGGDGSEGEVALLDPLDEKPSVQFKTRDDFVQMWGGLVIFLKRTHAITDATQTFGFGWFIPVIL